jgi:hypothetical protein
MKHVRQNRKAIEPIKKLIRPPIYTWTGNKAFNRDKRKRFDRLSHMLRDDEFLHFCAAIGWVEVNWSMMESQFDRWCQIAFITLEWRGTNGKEKVIPRPYGQKVRFLRGAFTNSPALAKHGVDGIALLDRADALADMRHDLTHGVITHMEARDGKYLLENRKIQRDGRHTVKEVVFDVRGFPALADKLVILGRDAIQFSHRLQIEFLGPR